MSSYPDEKDITNYSNDEVRLLWNTGIGIKVIVGQFKCNLILESAATKSRYIRDISKSLVESSKLYSNKIDNIKSFTLFWNWLNGVTKTIDNSEFKVEDYLDMMKYIIHFKCTSINFFIEYMLSLFYSNNSSSNGKVLRKYIQVIKSFVEFIYLSNSKNIELYKMNDTSNALQTIDLYIKQFSQCTHEEKFNQCNNNVKDKNGLYCDKHIN